MCVGRVFIKSCGLGLMCFFFMLASFIFYSFSKDVMGYYNDQNRIFIQLVAYGILIFFVINMVFNYLSAAFSSPGTTSDKKFRDYLY